jgi:hypothetical protein
LRGAIPSHIAIRRNDNVNHKRLAPGKPGRTTGNGKGLAERRRNQGLAWGIPAAVLIKLEGLIQAAVTAQCKAAFKRLPEKSILIVFKHDHSWPYKD